MYLPYYLINYYRKIQKTLDVDFWPDECYMNFRPPDWTGHFEFCTSLPYRFEFTKDFLLTIYMTKYKFTKKFLNHKYYLSLSAPVHSITDK